jgi:hypothetical protein
MRKARIFTAAAALGMAGGAFALGIPAASAAVPASIPFVCSQSATKFAVAQNGINIRSTPGGSIEHAISKTATFNSRKYPNNQLGWTCITDYANPPSGTQWVYGEGQANQVIGWVGINYLNVK